MTADEMFEELGYTKKVIDEVNYIEYNRANTKAEEIYVISFEGLNKTIMASLYLYTKGYSQSRALAITPDELKAINKKVEELQWN